MKKVHPQNSLSHILSLSHSLSLSLKDDSEIHEAKKSNKVRIRTMFDCELKFEEVVDELLKKTRTEL